MSLSADNNSPNKTITTTTTESPSSSSSSSTKITLMRAEGELFVVDEAVASEASSIKHMIDDQCSENIIPLPNITTPILAKIVQYCHKHVQAGDSNNKPFRSIDDDLRNWDADFMKVDLDTLHNLIMAAHYLSIKNLYDLACQTAANMIKGKKPEEIREIFKIENDLSPEEVEEIRTELNITDEPEEELPRPRMNIKTHFTREEKEDHRRRDVIYCKLLKQPFKYDQL